MKLKKKYIEKIRINTEDILCDDIFGIEIPAIKYLAENVINFDRNVTFFVGEHGTGKTTIIKTLILFLRECSEYDKTEFQIFDDNFDGYFYNNVSETLSVETGISPKECYFIQGKDFYSIEEFEDASHGKIFNQLWNDYVCNDSLYFIDEPEAGLSPQDILRLMCEIHGLENNNCQIIIATNSPILLAYPGARIYEFSDKGIAQISYKETNHYIITKAFLDCSDRMLKHMFR